jgi:hypothetical protein
MHKTQCAHAVTGFPRWHLDKTMSHFRRLSPKSFYHSGAESWSFPLICAQGWDDYGNQRQLKYFCWVHIKEPEGADALFAACPPTATIKHWRMDSPPGEVESGMLTLEGKQRGLWFLQVAHSPLWVFMVPRPPSLSIHHPAHHPAGPRSTSPPAAATPATPLQ